MCVCARALYYLRGLKAFNVLAALVLLTRVTHMWR